jgi:acyl-coenzyme A synthetase/AMP-(fatty) acid ligase
VHFELFLNLVWLLLGLLALASTGRAALRRSPIAKSAPAWLHVVGVGLIVVALFPYISATDDVLRIEHFNSQHDQQRQDKQSRTDNLMRLYETADSGLVSHTCEVAMTLFVVGIVFTPAQTLVERIAPLEAGRSPPFAAVNRTPQQQIF